MINRKRLVGLFITLFLFVFIIPAPSNAYLFNVKPKEYTYNLENDYVVITKHSPKENSTYKVKLQTDETPLTQLSKDTITQSYKDFNVEVYEVENGLEYMIILNKKPNTNSINIEVSDEYQYYKQQSLTSDYNPVPEGWKVNDTHAYNEMGVLVDHRPIESVNSYAVYKSLTKKILHIYRIQAWDSVNNKVYGDMAYKEGVLTITLPQDFLDKAVYPVHVDPLFGFTVAGGSNWNMPNDQIKFIQYAYAGPGLNYITMICAHIRNGEADDLMQAALYTAGQVYVNETEELLFTGDGWYNFTFTDPQPVLTNQSYYLAVWSNSTANHPTISYNAGQQGFIDNTGLYNTWTNPIVKSSIVNNRKLSIYGVYQSVAEPSLTGRTFFRKGSSGWLNVTIDMYGGMVIANISTVTVTVTPVDNADEFELLWTEATNTYSESSDPGNVCSLNVTASGTGFIGASEAELGYYLTIIDGEAEGDYNVTITILMDGGASIPVFFRDAFRYSPEPWNVIGDIINDAFDLFNVLDYMPQITDYIGALSGYLAESMINAASVTTQQIRIVAAIYTWFIRWFTRFVDMFLTMGGIITGLLNGTGAIVTQFGNWWTLIELNSWLELIVLLTIIAWFDSVAKRGQTQGEITVFFNDLQVATNIMSYFLSVFNFIIDAVVSNVFRLFDAIT